MEIPHKLSTQNVTLLARALGFGTQIKGFGPARMLPLHHAVRNQSYPDLSRDSF